MKILFITIVSFLIIHDATFPQDEKIILSLSGSGIKNSEPFTVNKPWEIEWFNGKEDMVFSVYLKSLDGELIEVLASTSEYGTGSTYCYKKGKFYLSIHGMGNWKIKITDESNSQKSTGKDYNIPEKRVFNHPSFSSEFSDDYYFEEKYNKSTDKYIITVNLRLNSGLSQLSIGAYYVRKVSKEKFSSAMILRLVSNSKDWKNLDNPHLIFLVDGEKIDLGEMEREPDGIVETSLNFLTMNIPTKSFLKIINGSDVKGKLAATEFKLSEEQLEAFRDFASRMK